MLLYHEGLVPGNGISLVNPGAFIYWAEIVHTGGGLTVAVLQDPGGVVEIDLADDGPKLFDADCNRVQGVHSSITGGDVTVSKNNLAAGTYYLTVKYDSQSLAGEEPDGGSFTYSWSSSTNDGDPTNQDSLAMKPT